MSANKLQRISDNHVAFRCPGCGDDHVVDTRRWTWNGSMTAPTFSPSLLVRSGHFAPQHKPGDECWCTFEHDTRFSCHLCHSFVRDGEIQFLSDCSHDAAGSTMPLPDAGG